jgi:hypothetical protein
VKRAVIRVDTSAVVGTLLLLATLLYHGMRREELCWLKVRDIQDRA